MGEKPTDPFDHSLAGFVCKFHDCHHAHLHANFNQELLLCVLSRPLTSSSLLNFDAVRSHCCSSRDHCLVCNGYSLGSRREWLCLRSLFPRTVCLTDRPAKSHCNLHCCYYGGAVFPQPVRCSVSVHYPCQVCIVLTIPSLGGSEIVSWTDYTVVCRSFCAAEVVFATLKS
jgi:hypothetical protein